MPETNPLNKSLLALSLAFGFFYLFVGPLGLEEHKPFLKPLVIWGFAAVAFLSRKPGSAVLGIGLLFGSGGDILLETGPFLAGVGSFLISQLIYAGLFVWIAQQAGTRGLKGFLASTLLVLVVVAYGNYLYPDLGNMIIPIMCYLIAISFMGITSLVARLDSLWASIGALSFIVSDSLIALGLFKFDFVGRDALVWITYVAAQFLITVGILGGWQDSRKLAST